MHQSFATHCGLMGLAVPRQWDDLQSGERAAFSAMIAGASSAGPVDRESVELLRWAREELSRLRRSNEVLAAKVSGFEMAHRLFAAWPSTGETVGMGEDVVWRIEKKLAESEAALRAADEAQKVVPAEAAAE